ncbi:MAG TPA: hypothetical protein VJ939_04495 [Bacteroidales bacterium]|nr:hypothetical protein [Bacteroidales bacterium]
MFIKIVIITVILGAIVALPMLLNYFFNNDLEYTIHSCGTANESTSGDGICSSCQIKDLPNCDYQKPRLHKSQAK